MDWLTRELTDVDKVRRNVILLAALSTLLAYFPVQTEQISLLGARFTSEVVAFALFHALVFYTCVLFVRAWIHGRVSHFEANKFEHALELQLKELDLESHPVGDDAADAKSDETLVQEERARIEAERLRAIESQRARMQRLEAQIAIRLRALEESVESRTGDLTYEINVLEQEEARLASIRQSMQQQATEIETASSNAPDDLEKREFHARLSQELVSLDGRAGEISRRHQTLVEDRMRLRDNFVHEHQTLQRDFERDMEEGRKSVERLLGSIEDEADRAKWRVIEQRRASADLRAEVEWKATQRSRVLVVQGPFANFVRLYIMVGEYLFPIAFGAIASVMLYLTQKVAMLWELTPRWVE